MIGRSVVAAAAAIVEARVIRNRYVHTVQ